MMKHFRHLGGTVNALLIMHRQIQNLEAYLCGAKQELIIAPTVFGPPASQHWPDPLPVASPEDLRAAQSVFYPLTEKIGKSDAEEFVAQHVCFVHRSFWHRID